MMSSLAVLEGRVRGEIRADRCLPARRGGVAMGCLIAFAIVVILLIAGGIWLAGNWRWMVANPIRNAIIAEIDASALPDDQKQQLRGDVELMTDQFKSGAISLEELGRVGEQLERSPLLQIGAVYVVRSRYIEPSGLSEEEKADAGLHLERFARGIYEKSISADAVDRVIEPISDARAGDGRELRAPSAVSDADLREMVTRAKQSADEAGVPLERFEIDVAAEFRGAIERGLGRSLGQPGGG